MVYQFPSSFQGGIMGAADSLKKGTLPQINTSPVVQPTAVRQTFEKPTPALFKKKFVEKYPDGVANDGRRYIDIPDYELTKMVAEKYPGAVDKTGTPYEAYRDKAAESLINIPKSEFYAPQGTIRGQTAEEKDFTKKTGVLDLNTYTSQKNKRLESPLEQSIKAPIRGLASVGTGLAEGAMGFSADIIGGDYATKARKAVEFNRFYNDPYQEKKGFLDAIGSGDAPEVIQALSEGAGYMYAAGKIPLFIMSLFQGGNTSLEGEQQGQNTLTDKAIGYGTSAISSTIDRMSGKNVISGLEKAGVQKVTATRFVDKMNNYLKGLKPSDLEAGTEIIQQKIENIGRDLMGVKYEEGLKQYFEAGLMGKVLGKVGDSGREQADVTYLPQSAKTTSEWVQSQTKDIGPRMEAKYATQNTTDWASPTKDLRRGNKTLDKIVSRQTAKDIDSPQTLTDLGYWHDDHIVDGKYDTKATASEIKEGAIELSRNTLKPVLADMDVQAPRHTSLDEMRDAAIKRAKEANPKNLADVIEDIKKEFDDYREGGLREQYPDGFDRVGLHEKKIEFSQGVYDATRPSKNTAGKYISDVLRKRLEDIVPESIVPVKAFNRELEKYFAASRYLEELHAKPVSKSFIKQMTGRAAKGAGALVGGAVGSVFGGAGSIPGAIAGYQATSILQRMANNMSNPLKKYFLNQIDTKIPGAITKVGEFQTGINISGNTDVPLLPPARMNAKSNISTAPERATLPGGEPVYFGENPSKNINTQIEMNRTSIGTNNTDIGDIATPEIIPIIEGKGQLLAHEAKTLDPKEALKRYNKLTPEEQVKARLASDKLSELVEADGIVQSVELTVKGPDGYGVLPPEEVVRLADTIKNSKYSPETKQYMMDSMPKEVTAEIYKQNRIKDFGKDYTEKKTVVETELPKKIVDIEDEIGMLDDNMGDRTSFVREFDGDNEYGTAGDAYDAVKSMDRFELEDYNSLWKETPTGGLVPKNESSKSIANSIDAFADERGISSDDAITLVRDGTGSSRYKENLARFREKWGVAPYQAKKKVAQFKKAWEAGKNPSIDDFLYKNDNPIDFTKMSREESNAEAMKTPWDDVPEPKTEIKPVEPVKIETESMTIDAPKTMPKVKVDTGNSYIDYFAKNEPYGEAESNFLQSIKGSTEGTRFFDEIERNKMPRFTILDTPTEGVKLTLDDGKVIQGMTKKDVANEAAKYLSKKQDVAKWEGPTIEFKGETKVKPTASKRNIPSIEDAKKSTAMMNEKDLTPTKKSDTLGDMNTTIDDLASEARKYKSAEEFVKAQQKRDSNTFYHITDNPNFKINKDYRPGIEGTDYGDGLVNPKGLIVTNEPSSWMVQRFLKGRKYITKVDISKAKDGIDYKKINMGNPNEIFITNTDKAKVVETIPISEFELPKTKQQLLDIYNKANKKSALPLSQKSDVVYSKPIKTAKAKELEGKVFYTGQKSEWMPKKLREYNPATDDSLMYGPGLYLTPDMSIAKGYAQGGGKVHTVIPDIKNPLTPGMKDWLTFIQKGNGKMKQDFLIRKGYDAVVDLKGKYKQIMIVDPESVKVIKK